MGGAYKFQTWFHILIGFSACYHTSHTVILRHWNAQLPSHQSPHHTHLAQYPAQEVVVSREAFADEHFSRRARVQQAFIGGPEEALVGIEPWLEELTEELAEDPSSIDAGLIQAVSVQQVHTDTLLQIGLWNRQKEEILNKPDLWKNSQK